LRALPGTTFLRIWINRLFSVRLGTNVLHSERRFYMERDPRGDLYMGHDQKVWSTAAMLLSGTVRMHLRLLASGREI
jgi:hypothetical protein